eukprot:TRINITY_DN1842_c0_g1_i1.p1 TRINITY_DN1842_c0_g1~~TRINITY_DN1842_c0_g1_i1.p1  ORF type:complete len:678 (-),score=139.93 TRINITY_DN1842_c0_g1_i1:79-2112(-)
MDALLRCYRCFERLTDPRELRCGHVMCYSCVCAQVRSTSTTPSVMTSPIVTSPTLTSPTTRSKSAQAASTTKSKSTQNSAPAGIERIVCAQCQREHLLSEREISSLPISLVHKQLLQQETENAVLNPTCSIPDCPNAAVYCLTDPLRFLCKQCVPSIPQTRKSKKRHLVPWQRRFEPPVGHCWAHQNPAKYYCSECPWKSFLCEECKDIDKVKNPAHKKFIMDIEKANALIHDVASFRRRKDIIEQEIRSFPSKMEEFEEKLGDVFSLVDDEIQARFVKVNAFVDACEALILGQERDCRLKSTKALSCSENETRFLLSESLRKKDVIVKVTSTQNALKAAGATLLGSFDTSIHLSAASALSWLARSGCVYAPKPPRIHTKLETLLSSELLQKTTRPWISQGFPPIPRVFSSITESKQNMLARGGKVGELCHPWQLAVHPETKYIYVAEAWGNNRIQILDTDFQPIDVIQYAATKADKFGDPTGVAFSLSGDVMVVVENLHHRINFYTGSGTFIQTVGTKGSNPGEFNRPFFAAFDLNDDLWISDQCNHRLQKFSKDGKFLLQIESSSMHRFSEPMGIAVNSDNEVLVVGISGGTLYVFDTSGNYQRSHRVETTSQNFLCRGPDGGFVMCDRGGRVHFYNRDGDNMGMVKTIDPIGCTFLDDGKLLLSNSNSCVISMW